MFKLVVLSALLAVVAARPGHLETPLYYSAPTVTVQESSLAHVGNIVKSVPSAVSHHSNSVVHSSAHVVEDVVAPAVKHFLHHKNLATPVVETYAAAAPVVHTYAAAAPVVQTYSAAAAPIAHTYAAAPLAHTYAALPAVTSYAASAPLTYTATGVW
ncbi:LOW QUALITY PROTEIN: larval/pupal cuticle protein H1C [Stomoxys calcitrans]|uniref:LOW QUALITY PROTEIN: larval/pupal cuticle protein H1C n=1 Tax=Stomoxys calcitrans TaxID=35570 RepID=UPI0027E39DD4|nr:LOW QUALITY PROTEIN: larval/pupal cuticle protein H1C [Stomoxys calcitrans]